MISIQTLTLAISAILKEIEMTKSYIQNGDSEIVDDLGLQQHVLELQGALGELASHYEELREDRPDFPSVDEIAKSVKNVLG